MGEDPNFWYDAAVSGVGTAGALITGLVLFGLSRILDRRNRVKEARGRTLQECTTALSELISVFNVVALDRDGYLKTHDAAMRWTGLNGKFLVAVTGSDLYDEYVRANNAVALWAIRVDKSFNAMKDGRLSPEKYEGAQRIIVGALLELQNSVNVELASLTLGKKAAKEISGRKRESSTEVGYVTTKDAEAGERPS